MHIHFHLPAALGAERMAQTPQPLPDLQAGLPLREFELIPLDAEEVRGARPPGAGARPAVAVHAKFWLVGVVNREGDRAAVA